MASDRRRWTRDELLVTFNLYCRTSFGRMDSRNPDVVDLAQVMSRTPGAVAMKLVNLASLDPLIRARGIKGLQNASRADRELFEQALADWEHVAELSEDARARIMPLRDLSPPRDPLLRYAGPTEVEQTVKARRAQSLLRATVLASYNNRCAISGINVPALLQVSHIIPWAADEHKRLDPRNSIALSALHDRAFDRGLITIDKNLRVVVSGQLHVKEPSPIHVAALLSIHGQPLTMPDRYGPDLQALEYHRKHIFADKVSA